MYLANGSAVCYNNWQLKKSGRIGNLNKPQAKDFFTIPNILSYFRIILIPLFVYLYRTADDTGDYYTAALIIGLSGLTDFLDGVIARNCGQITELGMVLDPFADKLTQAAVAFCLASRFPLMWALFALLVARESYLLIEGVIMLKRGKSLHGSRWYGKVSTFIFYLVILVLLLFPTISQPLSTALIAVCGVFMLIAFILYIAAYSKMKKESPDDAEV